MALLSKEEKNEIKTTLKKVVKALDSLVEQRDALQAENGRLRERVGKVIDKYRDNYAGVHIGDIMDDFEAALKEDE